MMKRYLSSAPIGLAVTFGLLFTMQALIESGNAVIVEPRERGELDFVHVDRNEEIREIVDTPTRIPDPIDPPPTPQPDPSGERAGPTIYVGHPPPATPTGETTTQFGVLSDGPLVNVIRVQPVYPSDMSQRGIEGFVVVRFDVNEDGTVSNVRVVESSHRGFERNAIRAAEKFRYKPRVVDGVAVATSGVGYRFRFEMDK